MIHKLSGNSFSLCELFVDLSDYTVSISPILVCTNLSCKISGSWLRLGRFEFSVCFAWSLPCKNSGLVIMWIIDPHGLTHIRLLARLNKLHFSDKLTQAFPCNNRKSQCTNPFQILLMPACVSFARVRNMNKEDSEVRIRWSRLIKFAIKCFYTFFPFHYIISLFQNNA